MAAVLSRPLSWQGLRAGSWDSPSVPTLGCHPAAWDHRPRDAGGSQAQGWGDSRTLEEPRSDENCQSFAGAGSLRGRRAFLAGAWEVWAAEPPSEHRWFLFGRLSKELAAWVSPLPRRAVFVCLGKDEPHYLSSLVSDFKAQQEEVLRWETALESGGFAWRSAGGGTTAPLCQWGQHQG